MQAPTARFTTFFKEIGKKTLKFTQNQKRSQIANPEQKGQY